jgi:hypothetical protein
MGKKRKRVSAERRLRERDEQESKPTLCWHGPDEREDDLTSDHIWETECGSYRIIRSVSKLGQTNRFIALVKEQYHNGPSWDFVDRRPEGNYPREHRTLPDAFQAVNMHCLERRKVVPTSNEEEVLVSAEKQKLTLLPYAVPASRLIASNALPSPSPRAPSKASSPKASSSSTVRRNGVLVFGRYPLSRVGNWMGLKGGWDLARAKRALEKVGVDLASVKDSTLKTALTDGRNPKYSKPADLMDSEIKQLEGVK